MLKGILNEALNYWLVVYFHKTVTFHRAFFLYIYIYLIKTVRIGVV